MEPLSIRQAAAKYNIPTATLRWWVRDGMVRIVQRAAAPGRPTYIVEADVAALAAHYQPGPGRGKRQRLRDAVKTQPACTN